MSANDIFSEIQAINKKINELKTERVVAFEKFKKEFVERMTACEKIFENLDPDIDFSHGYTNDRLIKLASDGKTLTLTFGYSFRNEWNEYDVDFPARYMTENGLDVMNLDAAKLTKIRDEAQAIKEQQELERERAEFFRLKAKLGDLELSPQSNS